MRCWCGRDARADVMDVWWGGCVHTYAPSIILPLAPHGWYPVFINYVRGASCSGTTKLKNIFEKNERK